ncbi:MULTISPECIES: diacylglycerol kinase family protein [unclassified Amycolatopsis]|uniref:diacylglycerol/lipid kinase family protein n=1 Tax=Amycolatopsis TaxID=1813 RepID=UPI00026255C9|nr:diacylglycerol kinase family protein [Amycolatopsis sp. ATCC 39116]
MTGRAVRVPAARRGFALAALLAGAAALAVTVLVLLRDPLELVVAAVLVGVAVAAAWAALVRRGPRRVLSAAVAVLALAATVALPDLRAYLWFLVVVVLVALSGAATRAALGHPPSADGKRVGPARHGVLILNPRSGGGKAARFGLAERARALGVEPVELRPGDDLRALAEQAADGGADVLGMAGGDGSQALVADVARRHGLAFVCVPAGTRNHLALDLGLDREDVPAALAAFGDALERRIDLAELNGRVFVNNVSLGVYASVVQSPDYRDAKAATVARQLPGLLGPDAPRPDLRFGLPDGSRSESADVVLVSNGPYRLEHLSGFGTRERLDRGSLGVVTVTVNRAAEVPRLVSAEMAGRISRFPGYRSWSAPEFVVESGLPAVEAGVDGEAARLAPPLRFRILPGALRVRVPRDAPGASPAALLPPGTRAVVAALFRVLSGRTT